MVLRWAGMWSFIPVKMKDALITKFSWIFCWNEKHRCWIDMLKFWIKTSFWNDFLHEQTCAHSFQWVTDPSCLMLCREWCEKWDLRSREERSIEYQILKIQNQLYHNWINSWAGLCYVHIEERVDLCSIPLKEKAGLCLFCFSTSAVSVHLQCSRRASSVFQTCLVPHLCFNSAPSVF